MPAVLLALTLAALPPSLAPLEPQATGSLRQAQRSLREGEVRRGMAILDSLLMSDGVTVAMEVPVGLERSVARGFEAWNAVLGERAFRLLPPGSPADVKVRFVRSLADHGDHVQGFVEATRDLSWSPRSHSYRLKSTIFVRDNADGRALCPDEVTAVVAHESGHLLGLADVERDDRLMGPMSLGSPMPGPMPDEVEAVRAYRTLLRQSYPKQVDKR